MTDDRREGAKQPKRFDPARAARLDDPARFAYLAPADVLALLSLDPGATLLDFGTGTGTYAIEIARARRDVRIYALDEQAAMLDLLSAKLAGSAITTVEPIGPGDVALLRASIDRIFALNVLHEIGDTTLRELTTLLRPAGRVLIVDWNADVERPVGPPREHVYGVEDARRRLETHGFAIRQLTLFAYHYAFIVEAAH